MKKILALTAALTLCYSAPVTAGAIINFGLSDERGSAVIIVPSRQQYWGNVGYQDGWSSPYYHPYKRYNRFDDPRYPGNRSRHWRERFDAPRYRGGRPYYRYSRFDDPRVGESRSRHRDGRRYYHPRRSFIQFGIGF